MDDGQTTKQIVIATDGSAGAYVAVEQGVLLAKMLDAGSGTVIAVTYEYGNTFLMTAGLLNALVILDAFDIAMGRK